MQQRRGRAALREVAVSREQEPPVGDVRQRGERVAADRADGVRRSGVRGIGRDADEEDQQRGEQPSRPSAPELLQADGPRSLELEQDQGRDQEAAEDEERIDPEEAARRPRHPAVEQEDPEHGDPPDPVERPDVLQAPVTRSGLGHAFDVRLSPSPQRGSLVRGPGRWPPVHSLATQQGADRFRRRDRESLVRPELLRLLKRGTKQKRRRRLRSRRLILQVIESHRDP